MKLVLKTNESYSYIHELNNFENDFFGEDFKCGVDEIAHWINSKFLFIASIVSMTNSNKYNIEGICSMLFVTKQSALKLIDNKICECKLEPASKNSANILYYSSAVSRNKIEASLLLKSIYNDILQKRNSLPYPQWILAISTSESSNAHLSKSNFTRMKIAGYKNKYPFMKLGLSQSLGGYWSRFFNLF
jgi:hypothetical protein